MRKKFEKINVDSQTAEYIRYVAKQTNKPISRLLSELFSALIQQACNFKTANISYIVEYDNVVIKFSGSGRVVQAGHFQIPENASDGKINDKIKQEFDKGR